MLWIAAHTVETIQEATEGSTSYHWYSEVSGDVCRRSEFLLIAVRVDKMVDTVVDSKSQTLDASVQALIDNLKRLELICSKDEFNELCYILTLEDLRGKLFITDIRGRRYTITQVF